MKSRILKISIVTLLNFTVFSCIGQNIKPYNLFKQINLPGDGKWDYSCVDEKSELLYVSHADRVHVINLEKREVVDEWLSLSNVHGIAADTVNGNIYFANTGENNLMVFDSKNPIGKLAIALPKGLKPDCVLFDTFSNKVFVFCGKSNNAFVIDAKTKAIIDCIELPGKPEFACSNNNGSIFNNIADKNEVVVIDARKHKIVNRFSLGENKKPSGIAIDKENNRLFVTCEGNEKLVVLNAKTGQIIDTLPIGKKTDGVIYDNSQHLIVTSNGEGSATIIQQVTKDKYKVLQTLKTQIGLKTISFSLKHHCIISSGAKLSVDEKTIVPNTFAVYLYTNK